MKLLIQVLRWLAVIPSAVVVYLIANWLVLLAVQYAGEDSIFGLIPIFYTVEVLRAAIAPYAAVRAGAFVAGTGKVVAASLVAVLFVIGLTLMSLGLLLIARTQSYSELPIWFSWLLVPIMLVSAGVGVYQEYQEFVETMRLRERAEIADSMRPYYKTLEGDSDESEEEFEVATTTDQ